MIVYGKDGNKRVERGKIEIPPGADITHRSSIELRRSVVLEHPKASARFPPVDQRWHEGLGLDPFTGIERHAIVAGKLKRRPA